MIWPFRSKTRAESDEIRQAREATTRATDTIDEVHGREGEVDRHYKSLRARRLQNNFGDALVVAMERR